MKQEHPFNKEGFYDLDDDFQAAAEFERENTIEEIARYRHEEFQEMLKEFLKAEESIGQWWENSTTPDQTVGEATQWIFHQVLVQQAKTGRRRLRRHQP